MRAHVEVAGAEQLAADGATFRARVNAATFLRASRLELLERTVDLARVEAPKRTNALARSIAVRAAGGAELVEVGAAHGGPVHAGRRAGRRGGRMAPDPFLERAMTKVEAAVEPVVERELTAVMESTF